jgi:hypothetical protein
MMSAIRAPMLGACLVALASAHAGESPIRGADLSRHIAGPEVTVEQLAGKVVLLEYTGAY